MGGGIGVTKAHALGPLPLALTARRGMAYCVPLVRPVTVAERAAPPETAVQLAPLSLLYCHPVTDESAGPVQRRNARAFPGDAVKPMGKSGGGLAAGVAAAWEWAPLTAPTTARTWKV